MIKIRFEHIRILEVFMITTSLCPKLFPIGPSDC
jgi:hypothetical protein